MLKIHIDSTVKTPYIIMELNNQKHCYNLDYYAKYRIDKATVYCKEEDFQPEININQLKI
jgi:hypothetical protein